MAPAALGFEFKLADESQPASPNLAALQQISRGIAEISKRAAPAIVTVSVSKTVDSGQLAQGGVDPFEFFFGIPSPYGKQGPRGQREMPRQEGLGSGFFVNLDKGYVITNNHVIEGADEISVKLANGSRAEGKVVGRDPNTDIAVIQLKKFDRKGLGTLQFADSDKALVGDFVVAQGAPFGLESSVSSGIISALGRGSLSITELGDFIQTDAAINPGNSGGPLLDTSANVIGVNTAIFSRSGAYNGIGFAIPSKLVAKIAAQLIEKGSVERGFIGAALQPIEGEIAKDLGLPEGMNGALVANVTPSGPAAHAGVKPGDVITAVNDLPVSSVSGLVNTIGLMPPGDNAKLSIYRNGAKKTVDVKLAKYPNTGMAEGPAESESRGGPWGLSLAPVDAQTQRQFDIKSDHGAVVVGVDEDSPAARAGLRQGDVIVSVAGKTVSSPSDVSKELKGKNRALIRVERGGQYFFASLSKKGKSDDSSH